MKKLFPVFLILAMLPLTPALAHKKLEPRLNDLDAKLQRMQLLMDSQGVQEIFIRMQSMEENNRMLKGQIEELNHKIGQMKSRQRELYLDMDKRLQDMESSGSQGGYGSTTTSPGYPGGTYAEPQAGEEEQYRTSFNLLKEKRYTESVAAFEAFLLAYPQSELAPNAQYWMGEANYVAGRYSQAVRAFDLVRSEYPSSPKVADATLKLGYSYAAIGNISGARSVLNEVIDKYPGSSAAGLAKDRLKKLNSRQPR